VADEGAPAGSHFTLGREGAWDFSVIGLPIDGRFDLPNVPGEAVSLNSGMVGYRAAGTTQPKRSGVWRPTAQDRSG
jgi:hypothetical protein